MMMRRILYVLAGLFCAFLGVMVIIDGIIDARDKPWEWPFRLAVMLFLVEVALFFFRGLPPWSRNWKTVFSLQLAFFLAVFFFYCAPPVQSWAVGRWVERGSTLSIIQPMVVEEFSSTSAQVGILAGISFILMSVTKWWNRKRLEKGLNSDNPPREVCEWSLTAIWGFVLVTGLWAVALGFAVFFKLNSPPAVKYVGVAGAILSLIGGIICITKRGAIRGIGFAIAGLALFAAALGLAISMVLLLERDISLVIAVFFPIAFAAIAAVILYVPYLLLRRGKNEH